MKNKPNEYLHTRLACAQVKIESLQKELAEARREIRALKLIEIVRKAETPAVLPADLPGTKPVKWKRLWKRPMMGVGQHPTGPHHGVHEYDFECDFPPKCRRATKAEIAAERKT